MTPTATTLDAVDRGFLRRLEEQSCRRRPPATTCRDERPAPPCPAAFVTAAAQAVVAPPAVTPPVVAPPVVAVGGTLVDRLLHAVPQAWEQLAERVEAAGRDGAAVIAVTGARRGEGRTTVVECLARALERRGRRVQCHDRVPLDVEWSCGRQDSPVVLVDAGVWFPGGPLRRAWLQTQSLGCHAAIVVRRAGQPECPARGAALEAIGLKVLGEVVTMAPPTLHAPTTA